MSNSSVLNIPLQADVRSVHEVVVVGYRQKSTRKLTESIGTVQARDITRLPVANAEAPIQARVPGGQVSGRRVGSVPARALAPQWPESLPRSAWHGCTQSKLWYRH